MSSDVSPPVAAVRPAKKDDRATRSVESVVRAFSSLNPTEV